MITTTNDVEVERSGIETESSFTIRASRKAFEILSSGLYSDKKLAIVREILANSWDAHVAARNMNPPLVHLPNAFEPWISFRDFGTGLSHEQMTTLYTTYFDSSKTTSNDFTGCLGLGSKSPFSYVDSFTVVSYHNGEKRTYNAFIDENGVPAIALLTTEETKEANGLDVTVPVKAEDFNDFRMKLQKVVKRFKVQPKVVGNNSYSVTPVTYGLSGNGWKVRTTGDEGAGAIAVMGNIGYPIDLTDDSLTDEHRAALRLNVDLHFAIGQLDIAASREKLSFNKETIANIRTRLDVMIVEVRDILSKKLAAAKNLWEARCIANQIMLGEYSAFRNLVTGSVMLEWNGHKLSAVSSMPHGSNLQVNFFEKMNGWGRRKYRKDVIRDIPIRSNIEFYFNDLPRGGFIRAMNMAMNGTPVFMLTPISEPPSFAQQQQLAIANGKTAQTWPTAQEQLATFIKNLGIDPSQVKMASTMPHPPRRKGVMTDKGKARILRFDPVASASKDSDNWKNDVVDLNAGGVYVIIDRYLVRTGSLSFDNAVTTINSIRANMKKAGFNIEAMPIYGVKQGHANKVQSLSNWKELSVYCSEKVTKKVNDSLQLIADSQALTTFVTGAKLCMNHVVDSSFPAIADQSKPFAQFAKTYAAFDAAVGSRVALSDLVSGAGEFITIPKLPKPSMDLQSGYDAMMKHYPLLGLLNEVTYNGRATRTYQQEIADYVNLMDKQ